MAVIRVGEATVEDAAGIARVHVQAWREAYADVLPAQLLAELDEQIRAQRWAERLAEKTFDAFVAVDVDDVVVGWATGSDGRDDDGPAPRELQGIYILESTYGSGAATALLEAAIGDSPAYLWILDDNPRATAFYRKHGFEFDGASKCGKLGGHPVTTLRMVRGPRDGR